MKKLQLQSLDLKQEKLRQLKQIFPHLVTESKNSNNELILNLDFQTLENEFKESEREREREIRIFLTRQNWSY